MPASIGSGLRHCIQSEARYLRNPGKVLVVSEDLIIVNKNESSHNRLRGHHYKAAITSISTSASFGSRATCTVERAGGAEGKYRA